LTGSPVIDYVANVNAGGIAAAGGSLTLIDSPVENNAATSTSGTQGGGVGVFGGTVMLKRSPVVHSSGSGPIGGLGGGIVILNGASLSLQNSRVTDNTASSDGGGIHAFTGTVSLEASRVRRNRPNDCVNVPGCEQPLRKSWGRQAAPLVRNWSFTSFQHGWWNDGAISSLPRSWQTNFALWCATAVSAALLFLALFVGGFIFPPPQPGSFQLTFSSPAPAAVSASRRRQPTSLCCGAIGR